jgi:hypothetical protein
MTDDRSERRLRDWFDERAAGPVPEPLHDRLAAVPLEPAGGSRWTSVLGRGAGSVAGIAVVAGLAIAVLVIGSIRGTGAGSGPLPSSGSGPAVGLAAGDGVVELGIPWLPILATILAVWALVATWSRGRRLRLAGIALVGLVVAGDVLLGTGQRAVWNGGSVGAGPGFVSWQAPSDAERLGGQDDMVFAPGPRGSFGFTVTVTNGGPVPMTILGVDRASLYPGVVFSQVVGLGMTDPHVANGDPAAATPFGPVHLEPGEQANLVFLVDGGPCATTSATGSGVAYVISDVRLVTEAFGWPRVDTFSLPSRAIVRAIDNCDENGPINP